MRICGFVTIRVVVGLDFSGIGTGFGGCGVLGATEFFRV